MDPKRTVNSPIAALRPSNIYLTYYARSCLSILRAMTKPTQEGNRGLQYSYPRPQGGEAPVEAPLPEPHQEFRAELDRILNSGSFRHSDSLKRLLSYLGEKWLSSETEGLKEYTIGVEGFGKPSSYDPQDDPAVRVLASKLRRKLEEYYFKEGAKNPLRLSMPRGHYALELKPVDPGNEVPVGVGVKVTRNTWKLTSLVLALVAVFAWIVLLYREVNRPVAAEGQPWTPELSLIWGPFLEGDRATVISLGTPLFAKLDWGFVRNPRINDDDQLAESRELQLLSRQFGSTYAVPSHAYTGTGEAMGVFLLAQLLHGRTQNLVMQKSTTLTWDDVLHHNLIFVGPPKLNRLLKEMPMEGGFVLREGAIRNPNPRPGELEVYQDSWAPNHVDLLEDYALISRLRGLHDSGEIMILGASSTEATWAAVEYVTQPAHAKDLVRRVGLQHGALPDRYQVVVHVKFQKLVPVEISYTAHRVLQ